MELVSPPLSSLHLLLVLPVINVVSPGAKEATGLQRGIADHKHETQKSGAVRVLLAFFLCVLGAVGAVEKLPLKKLHSDDGKDEHEELIDNEDVEDVLQRRHNTVKHGLGKKNSSSLKRILKNP